MRSDAPRRPSSHRSDVATPAVLASTTGTLYVAGGLAVALGALVDPAASGWLFGLAAVAASTGAGVLRWGTLLPTRVLHVLVASGTGLIAAAVVLAPSPLTGFALAGVFTFVAIDVFYYFARRPALLQLVLLLTAACSSLASRGAAPGAVAAFAVVLVAVAVVVGDLAARASRAVRDPLTGLLNRRGFDTAVDAAVAESARADAPLCAALVDVDRFKAVNDAHGHAGGDALLVSIAAALRRALPRDAVLGRIGGDEFAVLLPGTEEEDAARVLERARRASRHPLSAGVVGHLPGEQAGELLRRADAALYQAKQAGRARTVLGDATSTHLSRDLAAALASEDGGGLHVALQPVVEVTTGLVVGVEALARWTHRVRGAVPPAEFVALAESAGLVPQLGALVLERACREAQLLREGWSDDLVLGVNASGRELVEPGYAERVLAVLRETGWPPEQLVVEVTESVVEGGSAAATAALSRLRDQGVRVAIDDFGAGYSAFARLDEIPADLLKIDRSLLQGMTTSARRRALVEAVLGVAASLGLEPVAEGVETAEQAQLLTALGCPLAQGYHYARPASAAELLAQPTLRPGPGRAARGTAGEPSLASGPV